MKKKHPGPSLRSRLGDFPRERTLCPQKGLPWGYEESCLTCCPLRWVGLELRGLGGADLKLTPERGEQEGAEDGGLTWSLFSSK